MADLIKIKGGSGNAPALHERELAYSKDKKALFIGTDDGNVKIGDENWESRIKNLEDGQTNMATQEYVEGLVKEINARLDALTTPNE